MRTDHTKNELTREIHERIRELITPQEIVTLMNRIEGLANTIRVCNCSSSDEITRHLKEIRPVLHEIRAKLIELDRR